MADSEPKSPPSSEPGEEARSQTVAGKDQDLAASKNTSTDDLPARTLIANESSAASDAQDRAKPAVAESLASEARELDPSLLGDSPSRIGERVDSYRLVRQLGQGGMGVVYEAVHEEIGQRVAIKLLAMNLAKQPAFRKRFLREAQAGSNVRHPGLVQIFNYGTLNDGTPFIQMEYLEGRLLRAYMAQQPDFRLPLAIALRLGRQIADALAAAHLGGVVHRDLKPDNVMLVADYEAPGRERTRVLDFGIAKFVRAPEMITSPTGDRPPGAIGTPVYMSPEQCRGDAALNGKSDVYSLGVMLYEMLCGRPPFVSDPHSPMAVVYQHVFADPRPPRQLRPNIPKPVEALLLRMLAKEPECRPNMATVAAEIETLSDLVVKTSSDRPYMRHSGARIAKRTLMVLLVLLPILFEIYYFGHHHELWWPGRALQEPAMVKIPASDFDMGSKQTEVEEAVLWATQLKRCKDCGSFLYERETPLRRVHVSSFYMDTQEVTNEDFVRWLNKQKDITVDEWRREVRINGLLIADLGVQDEKADRRYLGIEWADDKAPEQNKLLNSGAEIADSSNPHESRHIEAPGPSFVSP